MHNIAIIGLGKMGRIRKNIIASMPNCSLKWVCDVEPQEGNFKFTKDPDVIFNDDDVDIVFVCTPNYLNKDFVIRGLDSKKHVFCEKPAGISSAQVLEIIDAEKRNPECKVMIGFNHRRHQSVLEAKRLVDSGKFGEILWVRGRYGKSVDKDFLKTWRAKRAYAGGGILMDQGIHMLDLFLMFCGDFEEVKAVCSDLYWHLDIEDNVFAILRNSRGQVASLHSTMTQWRHLFSFELFMERGYIVINGLITPSGTYGKEELSVAENRTSPPQAVWTEERRITFSIDNSFEDEVRAFIECIDGKSPITTGNSEDALKVMRLVERIYAEGSV
ncbi:Gfo/Idh/MocA family oxidoreductase [Dehalococcoidia bacterium]|nr:Gfo/Idh/MocA family oxidoreductase [Dehalococcoidia bacterium]